MEGEMDAYTDSRRSSPLRPPVDGYFKAGSMMRRINKERAMILSGPRALLMQAAHPLIAAGFVAHTSTHEEPYNRLARTAETLGVIAYGSKEEADEVCRVVRAMHRRVRGTIKEPAGPYPAGTPYRADDPELLLWILFTLIDSSLVVYEKYVASLSSTERAAAWEDYKIVGRLFGLRTQDMPDTLADLDEYRREMLHSGTLALTDWAATRARKIVLDPPVPFVARPVIEALNFTTIALLPDQIRELYGFSPLPPAAVRKALVAGGAEYMKRVVIPLLPGIVRYAPPARAA